MSLQNVKISIHENCRWSGADRFHTRATVNQAQLEPFLDLDMRFAVDNEIYVLTAERLHSDDTTVPVLTMGKIDKGRIWTYVRDYRLFGGESLPAALYYQNQHQAR